ncbi:MAG: sel1 repeat family protein [Mesorhizobium sp.]|nr:tetratricopeptide repeat protein [Mesorhizobium sp.]MBL8577825.1 sel1 repeat family protein [Mesorhizobium sp.]
MTKRSAIALLLALLTVSPVAGAQAESKAPDKTTTGTTGAPEDATATAEQPGAVDEERFGGPAADAAYGAFQRGLYMTALNLAKPRAEAGDSAAQTLVAEILSRGLGVKRDEAAAAKWYQLAAEQGVPEAQFQYALLLIDGRFVKKDPNGAYALMQAAAEAGNRMAQFNFAQMVVQREPGPTGMTKAVAYYQRAADAGLADAQYAMSQVYAAGVGGKAKDDVQARRWLLLAARQNYDTAQVDLATWLVEGRGGQRDLKAGFEWMKRAAEGGNVAAQNRLAKLYMGGIGTEPDAIEAAAWYFVARRRGLVDAEMQDFLNGKTDEELKTALERANRLR